MGMAIIVKDLKKSYGSHEVLKGISFSVAKGEIFALLGANGAGKTTTLECLEGIRKYTGGSISLYGSIGVQLQSSSLPPNLKALEAINLFAKWKKAKIDMEYLKCLGVAEFKDKQYRALSAGQKRRLHLAIAMLGAPEIIFLDEPTAGLDVEGRISLHEEIRKIKSRGKTIIMASHDMAEVEALCDRIAILKSGNIAFIGSARDLTEKYTDTCRIGLYFTAPFNKGQIKNSIYLEGKENYALFETANLAESLLEITTLALAQAINIADIKVERASLEQRFMAISKEEL